MLLSIRNPFADEIIRIQPDGLTARAAFVIKRVVTIPAVNRTPLGATEFPSIISFIFIGSVALDERSRFLEIEAIGDVGSTGC